MNLSLFKELRIVRLVAFVWGYVEGVLFFIVPDVYISAVMLFSARAGLTAFGYSILGSLGSVCTVFVLMLVAPTTYLNILTHVPGVSLHMFDRVQELLLNTGLPYTPLLILGGVPLKVYTSTAFLFGFAFLSVLLWSIFARIARMAPVLAIFVVVRVLFARRIDQYPRRWLTVLAIAWILFYIYYFAAVK